MSARYNTIGIGYNNTRKADPYLASRLYHHLQPEPGKLYLDIGCGTGNYTLALQQKGVVFIGVDPSTAMLNQARLKSSAIQWLSGTAENIPLLDASVSGFMAQLTIHHWTNLNAAFKELFRVLKPGSKWVIFTTTPEQTGAYWLSHYFPQMIKDSQAVLPPYHSVETAVVNAGLTITSTEKYFVKPDLQDHFLYVGKTQPELYFNPEVRQGISSFSAFSNADEVTQGLAQLRGDIDSGKIAAIMQQYENDLGDYLYITGSK